MDRDKPAFDAKRSMSVHWRRMWCAGIVTAPIIYFLSVPVVQYAALIPHQRGYDDEFKMWHAAKWYCAPGNWCSSRSETLSDAQDWEWRILNATFGEIALRVP
jgi:hypothetical protein